MYLNAETNAELSWPAAYVRVRPALANEGRYFVRVPNGIQTRAFICSPFVCLSKVCMHRTSLPAGTNSPFFSMEEDLVRDLEDPLAPPGNSSL